MANTVSPAYKVDVAVIGAGVIGLAVARAFAQAGREVLIIDRASQIGSETSSRNSEVIHGGLYYPSSSLKAKFCVTGKQLLYDYCSDHISYNRCGKLILAANEQQWKTYIPALKEQAHQNGVTDVELLEPEVVKEMEPDVQCVGALWSPSTGVLDSHSFFLSLLADAEASGATLSLHSEIQGGNVGLGGGANLEVDDMILGCNNVVNCAGLWAHKIAEKIHKNHDWKPARQYYAKGNYFRLEGMKPPFSHLVYPVPEVGGLGVHATMDWSGLTTKFGPDVEWIDPSLEPDDIDMAVDSRRAELFYKEIRRYWPSLKDGALAPDYSGIRPKLVHPLQPGASSASKFVDFLIQGPRDHGVDGVVHLLGIESPGLTSSMAIADYVADLLDI